MAKGVLRTHGVRSDYAKHLLEKAKDMDAYEALSYQDALDEVRGMTDTERQAKYIKLHWDLARFCAKMRDKYDRKWRRTNAALLIKAEQEGLMEPLKETALTRFLEANLILQECISNVGFWQGKAIMHATLVANEKNARDLLGIPYPGAGHIPRQGVRVNA